MHSNFHMLVALVLQYWTPIFNSLKPLLFSFYSPWPLSHAQPSTFPCVSIGIVVTLSFILGSGSSLGMKVGTDDLETIGINWRVGWLHVRWIYYSPEGTLHTNKRKSLFPPDTPKPVSLQARAQIWRMPKFNTEAANPVGTGLQSQQREFPERTLGAVAQCQPQLTRGASQPLGQRQLVQMLIPFHQFPGGKTSLLTGHTDVFMHK